MTAKQWQRVNFWLSQAENLDEAKGMFKVLEHAHGVLDKHIAELEAKLKAKKEK